MGNRLLAHFDEFTQLKLLIQEDDLYDAVMQTSFTDQCQIGRAHV